jgi:hypothetical protein
MREYDGGEAGDTLGCSSAKGLLSCLLASWRFSQVRYVLPPGSSHIEDRRWRGLRLSYRKMPRAAVITPREIDLA